MDLSVSIHLIFLCVVNTIFTFSGIVLNALVIVSFWKSSQLRKKLCHFMIMVLSFFDLLSVISNHPGLLLYLIFWFREDYELLPEMVTYLHFATVFFSCSFLALLVMSFERYLGTHHPIFHRTSVTRRRLLVLFATLFILTNVTYLVSRNALAMSPAMFLLIFMGLLHPPFMFVNLKLLIIVRKVHRQRKASPEKKTTINFKNVSAGLWVVACYMLLSIPPSFRVAVNLADESANTLRFAYIWPGTCVPMNCTFNSLIFFWKNKVLRTEGIKILKTFKHRLVCNSGCKARFPPQPYRSET